MIRVTRFNGEQLILNADLIESIEATPDTIITLTTGHKLQVKESVDQLIGRIVAYERVIRIGVRHGKRKHNIILGKPMEGKS